MLERCGGRLDRVVISAGVGTHVKPPSLVASVNYFGAIEVLDGLLPALRGGADPAALVVCSNSAQMAPLDEHPYVRALLAHDEAEARRIVDAGDSSIIAYIGAKHALGRAVRRRAGEWGRAGVRLNAIAPGPVKTPLLEADSADPVTGPAIAKLSDPARAHGRARRDRRARRVPARIRARAGSTARSSTSTAGTTPRSGRIGSEPAMTLDAFAPARLGALGLRNRVIKTATYEGMCPGGMPSDALVEHHRTLAAGGVGLSTVAYCAVSPDGRTFAEQLTMRRETVSPLRRVTDAVHREGGAASLQLGHCGWFTKNAELSTWLPRGPSLVVNQYGISAGKPVGLAMSEREIAQVVEDFGRAAGLARDAGFDAVELHLGHGYLLSQFLCPATNRRTDRYGGDLDGRARALARRCSRACARWSAAGFPILCKTNLRDGFRGGLELPDAVALAQRLEAGGADALVLSGGFTSSTPFYLFRGRRPLAEMIDAEKSRLQKLALRFFGGRVIREYPFEEMFFLAQAREVRRAVRMPLVLLGGIVSRANVERAMAEGFDFVAMGRALIADPDLVQPHARATRARARAARTATCAWPRWISAACAACSTARARSLHAHPEAHREARVRRAGVGGERALGVDAHVRDRRVAARGVRHRRVGPGGAAVVRELDVVGCGGERRERVGEGAGGRAVAEGDRTGAARADVRDAQGRVGGNRIADAHRVHVGGAAGVADRHAVLDDGAGDAPLRAERAARRGVARPSSSSPDR